MDEWMDGSNNKFKDNLNCITNATNNSFYISGNAFSAKLQHEFWTTLLKYVEEAETQLKAKWSNMLAKVPRYKLQSPN